MRRVIFITGAARSGKSQLAVKLARGFAKASKGSSAPIPLRTQAGIGKVIFIATCVPKDDEMRRRVKLHKRERPSSWRTVEGEMDILKVLRDTKKTFQVVIIDCLTLFISGLLLQGFKEREIEKKVREIVKFISGIPRTTIIVSNEVGSGIVPENKLARQFRDLVGVANQIITRCADEVYFMVSGIPIKIKGGENGKTEGDTK